ncbi:MAG: DegV family protein [Clostridiales bacterium]|nr:DegV family protein [Clostridiales bacterium]
MYQLFCDSNCELWHTTVKELGLNLIRMPYIVGDEESFYDMGENHDFKGFFDKMRAGATPKTAALNEYAYMEYFEPVLARGEDIYYITFSHQMSGTFNAMQNVITQLKEKYPERVIRFKDSKLISLGSGFVTYYGALKYREGATMDELDAYLDDLIAHTATYFVVDDLTYLHRGGRVSGLSKFMGNLLGIKPILYFNEEGKILNIDKVKGMKKAMTSLIGYIKEKGMDLDKYKMFIMQADCQSEAETFANNIKATFGDLDIEIQPVGPVIGAHCGPGTIGLIFHAKEK